LLLLFCAAIVLRGRMHQTMAPAGVWDDPDGYAEVAGNLVKHRTFGLQGVAGYYPATSTALPTAARAPLYPALLAVARYPSDKVTSALTYGAINLILAAGTIVAVWRLARLWSLGPWAALLACTLVGVDPILLHYSTQVMTETLATFLAAASLVALTHVGEEASWRWALVAGVCAGLSILCRPEFLAWTACTILVFPFAAAGPRRMWRLALFSAAAAAIVAPWAIRNARVFGAPIITTTHGGITLLLANNPSFYEYLRSAPWGSTWDGSSINSRYSQLRADHVQRAVIPPSQRPVIQTVDEVAVDRDAYREAFQNIRNQPSMFCYSCLVRVGRLWAVLPHATSEHESASRRGMRYAVGIWYTFELALAVVGAWFVGSKLLRRPWIWGALLLVSYTAVHVFYWTDMRMRAPLTSVVALLVAVAVAQLTAPRRGATPLPKAA
jgi:4-amino-4-deoxy-L-arabinose transferase-like glycosyltransferase